MKIISFLHSRYIINDSTKKYNISNDNKYIIDESNNKLFHLFEMPEKCALFTVKLESTLNILKVNIQLNTNLLQNMVLNGLHIPSRNILFYLFRKNKNNQHLILNIIDTLNIPVNYNNQILSNNNNNNKSDLPNNLNIKLFNYQVENNKWMLDLEKNKQTFEYVDNNIIKIDNLYVDIEKERFMFDYKYNSIRFDGGALIDSPGLGKCHLPDTLIYVNNQLVDSETIWKNNAKNIVIKNNEEVADCSNLFINSYNKKSNNIESRKIDKLYRQHITSEIKKVQLENGLELEITKSHKLLTEKGWTNNFTTNDKIAISNCYINSNKVLDINIIKIIALKELNYITHIKNKFYIKCKNNIELFTNIFLNLANIYPYVNYKSNYIKLEYGINTKISDILNRYSISTILDCCKQSQQEFLDFILKLNNNKFSSTSYKKMLEYDIISRSLNKYLKIKKTNRKYDFYTGKLYDLDNKKLPFFKIKSIQDINYDGYVYDFYIKETHNYIANNIICHNTVCMISLAELNTSKIDINSHNISTSNIIKDKEHLKSKATLILAPNHLCEQWKNEINDKSNLKHKILLVTTKREFSNTTYQDIILADFVIVSFQFLNNPEFKNRWKQYHSCYHHSIMDETIKTMALEYLRNKDILEMTCPIFPLFYFHRLVVDECHELNALKNHDYYYQLINLIKSEYRWCISGTPFQNGNIDFYNIFNILTYNANTDCLLDNEVVNYIKTNLFRRNTNNSVRDEFTLNDINRTVIKLDFTVIERVMYDSYLSLNNKSKHNLYLKQLCCHPNLANKTKKALINCKTLDEINTGMITYNESNLLKQSELLETCNTNLLDNKLSKNKKDSLIKKIKNIESTIQKLTNNIKYFKEIIPKLNQQNECVVCMDKIKNCDIALTSCGHIYCYECIYKSCIVKNECPTCRTIINKDNIIKLSNDNLEEKDDIINKYGTKIAHLIKYIKNLLDTTDERCIIFSQFDGLLAKIGNILTEYNINNIFCKGSVTRRNKSLNSFKYDDNYRVIMLSIKNTASGINLMCASTVIFLEPVYGNKDYIISTEKQAISRVYRIGQKKQINVVHFIIKNTVEEEIYNKYNK